MRFAQMESFLAVAETLNFTAAAKSLYISQPALSKQISQLEDEIGTKLFTRGTRSVVLTPAGVSLVRDLKDISQQLKEAKLRAARIGQQEKKIFRIGCFDGAVTNDFLPAVYDHILEKDKEIQITLFRQGFYENKKALENDEVDMIITLDIEHEASEQFTAKNLIYRNCALVYSDRSPLAKIENPTVEDFSKETLFVTNEDTSPHMRENTILKLNDIGIFPEKTASETNFSTMFARVTMGHGYVILAEDTVTGNPSLRAAMSDKLVGNYIMAVWKSDNVIPNMLLGDFNGI